ncbi:MAG: ComEC/Rec2 family competence protein, partial [Pseudomonadota bacterium]
EATVVEKDMNDDGVLRLVLSSITTPDDVRLPPKVRVTVRTQHADPQVGSRVALIARLMPPPGPAAPGSFDFSQKAFFEGLGAVGFAISDVEPRDTLAQPAFRLRADAVRGDIAKRILNQLSGDAGGLAVALSVGVRDYLSDQTTEDMRDAGLAHMLAISGLHMALISGVIFFFVRLGLASVPFLALHMPIKAIAAGFALAAAAIYLVLSGASTPSQRAFVMVAIALAALLFGRRAISIRSAALAAAVVLTLAPHSVTSVSFQMSFAAVVMLISVFGWLQSRRMVNPPRGGVLKRFFGYLAITALSTLVAEAAIAPFAIYHFGGIASYGIIANLVAMPLLAFIVMPLIAVMFVLMPFGLEAIPLVAIGPALDLMILIAHDVAHAPFSSLDVAAWVPGRLAVIAAGGLWFCLWVGPLRLIGVGIIATAFLSPSASRPDILINDTGRLIGIYDREQDKLWYSDTRRREFVRESWERRLGAPMGTGWNEEEGDKRLSLACDRWGCLFRPPNWPQSFIVETVTHPGALASACAQAALVISRVPVGDTCDAAVIDQADLERRGAHSVRIRRDASGSAHIVVRAASEAEASRPWQKRMVPEPKQGANAP